MVMLKQLATLVFVLVQATLLPTPSIATADAYFELQPEWLQDYCVADRYSNITVSGMVKCKNSAHVHVTDFLFRGLNVTGNTANPTANAVTPVFSAQLPGLNGLGVAMARLDFAEGGISVPHTHPRASELLVVLKGALYAGFVNTTNHLFATTLTVGDVFVFPKGLVHFQLNVGQGNAKAISAFSSQNPGVLQVGRTLFGSNPPINDEVSQGSLYEIGKFFLVKLAEICASVVN